MLDLSEHFDRLAGPIQEALEYDGEYSLEDVRALVLDGSLQLWPGVHSFIISQIVNTPRQKYLHLFLGGGNLEEIKRLYHIILAWGRERGCSRASLLGRPGWQRTFFTKEEGWSTKHVHMTKEITDEQG